MSKGKHSIIAAGLKLYNEHGVSNVSQRTISDFLKISPGNLTYHFKKKEDIYEALFFEYETVLNESVSNFLSGEKNLKSFSELIELWYEDRDKYRFIFIDLPILVRANEHIREKYRLMVEVRKSIFLKTIFEFVDNGVMRPEEIENEYEFLYQRLHIVSDFYLNSEAASEGGKHLSKKEFNVLFFSAIYPNLTAEGKKQYNAIFNKK